MMPTARGSKTAQIPASVGGWNARDPLEAMKPKDAIVMENAIPGVSGVSVRPGSQTQVMGIGVAVSALLTYAPAGLAPKLFACAGAGIFDVTVPGPVGAATFTAATSDAWQGVNFGTPGGNYLIAANGADPVMQWNSTDAKWTPLSLTIDGAYQYPLAPSKLRSPAVFASRLWFVERDSLRAWFLPVQQIRSIAPTSQGQTINTAFAIDISAQCRLGGSLAAIGVYTRDGGSGVDDYLVMLTTAGEAVIYSGTDPTNVATWSLVGTFRVPPPIGIRCMEQAGSDLVLLTQQGVLPLSQILPLSAAEEETKAVTDKIKGAFSTAYKINPNGARWSLTQYPKGSLLIVNVPQSGTVYQQFVMQAQTGAWCSFKGLQATCWALLGDKLFFGTADGRVVLFDSGSTDDGAAILATILPAYSTFRSVLLKRFMLARPLFTGPVGYRPSIAVQVDYDARRPPLPSGVVPPGGAPWASPWYSMWGPKIAPNARWQSVRGEGQAATVLVQIATKNPFRMDHIDLQYETGGLL